MTSIIKATETDSALLSEIGTKTFVESHGHSASKDVINSYVNEKYNIDAFKAELSKHENIYHIIYHENQPAGYSKIIMNAPHSGIPIANATKMERIYLLKEFYGLKLGVELYSYNIDLSKKNNQAGMWLFVWKENQRAIDFYEKAGFRIIGSHDFRLTKTHSNPNHQMYLEYQEQ